MKERKGGIHIENREPVMHRPRRTRRSKVVVEGGSHIRRGVGLTGAKIHCMRDVIVRPRNVQTLGYPKGFSIPKNVKVEGGADLGVVTTFVAVWYLPSTPSL